MYSSGMPIMLLIGSVILAFSYWCDKHHLLTYAAAPPQFSGKPQTLNPKHHLLTYAAAPPQFSGKP
jgi:hypothetical protein